MEHQTENIVITYIYENITLSALENATVSVNLRVTNNNYTMDIDYDADGFVDNTMNPTYILVNHAPNVSITTPTRNQNCNVTVLYNLKDAESNNCTIIPQYSLNNVTWLDATMGINGDSIFNVMSTPAGMNYTFVWASCTDISDRNETVYFRIKPYDSEIAGDYATTDAFIVENYTPENWKEEWTGKNTDGGTSITTTELQDAIHHWLEDIKVREHSISSAAPLQSHHEPLYLSLWN